MAGGSVSPDVLDHAVLSAPGNSRFSPDLGVFNEVREKVGELLALYAFLSYKRSRS
jgi:hypothetical protein